MNKNQGLVHSLLLCAFLSLGSTSVHAQITPDKTLGTEASKLTPNVLINGASADLINGGAQRGNNLFHSFSEFNIKDGQGVYFANPVGVVNILTRVTGNNASNILGTLGVDGGANLFLINPNGILFGQNARLDIGGSFVGTTANGVQFGNQGNFSATNPEAPGLLTINPSALFFNQINPNAAIVNNSVAPAGIALADFKATGLRVPDGKSLLLVGGNVIMDGGQLNAFGGRVELGGLVSKGNVNMSLNGSDLRLEFPDNVTRATVTLNNTAGAFVTGAGAGGGYLTINASNIDILSGSILSAGIGQSLGAPETIAGDITLSAIGEIKIAGSGSQVRNLVRIDSKGHGGNITINAGSLKLEDGATLEASTYGKGNAGNVTVTASDSISLAGSSYIFSTIEAGGVGKGGDININGATLSLTDGAQLLTITRGADGTQPAGKGSAGNVNVKVSGTVDIAGQKNGFNSGILSNVGIGTEGSAGNITIDTGSLKLRDGANLSASTYGIGNAGNVTITASDSISLAGQPTTIFSTVEAGGVGKGGDININGATLSLTDGAQLLTITRGADGTQPAGKGSAGNVNVKVSGTVDIAGQKNGFYSKISSDVKTETEGNAGNITIDAGSLNLRDGATLEASTYGIGNAGNVTITASDSISLAGQPTTIFSIVEAGGVGKGGDININGTTLSLTDGAQLGTGTRGASDTQRAGRGDAGNVNIRVTGVVEIAGEKDTSKSAIDSRVETGTIGNAGNITIDTGSLKFRSGAGGIAASSFGRGNAGNVTVRAKNDVSLVDGNIFSTVEAGGVGDGGNIDINASSLSLLSGAQLLTFTREASDTQPAGQGNAGNINVRVTGDVDIAGEKNGFSSQITSSTAAGTIGNGGNITINSASFSLRDNAKLSASTRGQGNAGNIDVEVTGAVTLLGTKDTNTSAIFSGVEAGGVGKGGNITIDADSFLLRDKIQLTTSTSGQGNAGNVIVRAKNAVSLVGGSILTTVQAGGVGKGGNIDINAAMFSLTDGAQLQTITFGASNTQGAGQGSAGNVSIKVTNAVEISGFGTAIGSLVETGTQGNGGNITIDANSFYLRNGAKLDARTENNNKGGDITVNTNVFETLTGGQLITTTSNNGRAGKITINATDKILISSNDLNYDNSNAGFFVTSTGAGTTGDIEINSPNIILDNQGKLEANSASGNGGNINLNSNLLLLRRGAQISTNAGTEQVGGDGGNIDIDSRFIVAVPNENSDITANAFTGKGGNVNIRAQGIFGIEPRATESPQTSDITASSDRGVQGEISITEPDVEPEQGLIELPEEVVDATRRVAQICPREPGAKPLGEFTITGRGSLPPSPLEALPGTTNNTKLATLDSSNINVLNIAPSKAQNTIVEAQGWVKNVDGSMELVAMAPVTTANARVVASACPGR
ncbi:filamentous hemagglutinin outer membrane protein (plasmid) [Calothrix sp. NIES-4071]|nr:filamentous hemagglutinin outer membrane protein [Calothrix sp. NIES-4071]BAZ64688.1 filamentous hemagglutinin outer membrane protein [Calothrix sp. NIES-4105]